MPKKVLILQHVKNEDAGTVEAYLRRKKIPYSYTRLFKGEILPTSAKNVRAVIIMGGPMNVYEEKKYPFLKMENVFLKNAIRHQVPCFGICLGVQLLSKALGGKVTKAKAPEIGWSRIKLTAAGRRSPLFVGIKKKTLKVLQWHEDTFQIPKGAKNLASGELVKNQALEYKGYIFGFQFHVEADRAMLEDWFEKSGRLPGILRRYDRYKSELNKSAVSIYSNFFSINETKNL